LNIPFALLLSAALLPAQSQAQGFSALSPWNPQPEPPAWGEVRRSLEQKGPPQGLTRRPWIFLRSLDRPDLRVGEYLAELTAAQGSSVKAVVFTAAVVVQRPGEAPGWIVNEGKMRVLSSEQSLQMLDPNGAWVGVPGKLDPEAPARLAWMCRTASP
jgi:hypothetical protein